MIFRQIYEDGLAQASYFFGCPATGEAMVIDPRRDIDVYLQMAQEMGLTIVAVGETHIHADFLSGARELGVRIVACQMSMDVMGIHKEELIDGVEVGGVATFLGDATRSKTTLFI